MPAQQRKIVNAADCIAALAFVDVELGFLRRMRPSCRPTCDSAELAVVRE
jgi:hypothetical protein